LVDALKSYASLFPNTILFVNLVASIVLYI
jgi:hypothetical protein